MDIFKKIGETFRKIKMSKKHPTTEELIAYSNDNLNDSNEMNFIKGHLDNCDICFQLVTDYSIKGIDINKQQKILNELNSISFRQSKTQAVNFNRFAFDFDNFKF